MSPERPLSVSIQATLSFATRDFMRLIRLPFFTGLLILLLAGLASGPVSARNFFSNGNQQPQFLPVNQAFQFSSKQSGDRLVLHWQIAPGYYLYRGRIKVTASTPGVSIGTLHFSSPGSPEQDPYFGKVTVFDQDFGATADIKLPEGTSKAHLTVTYQGCARAGLCYPPQDRQITFTPTHTGASKSAGKARQTGAGQSPVNAESAGSLAEFLKHQSTGRILLAFFLLGLGLAFTPCVLPMLPIISTLVGSRRQGGSWSSFGLALAYVLGMAITYSLAGVLMGLLGASFNVQALLQSPWSLGIAAAVFVFLALGCFDVYQLQLPGPLRHRLQAQSQQLRGGHLLGVFAIGALSALVVSPCVTPPLAGALLFIGATQDALKGALVLFVLALGMGVPLIAIAVAGRRILPDNGPWLSAVKAFYGVLLLAVSIWLVSRFLPGPVTLTLWALLAGICGVQLGAFDAARAGWPRFWKGSGLLLFIYAGLLLAGALAGGRDPLQPLSPFLGERSSSTAGTAAQSSLFRRVSNPDQVQQLLKNAAQAGRPAVIDLYADWCISCQEMDRNVFSAPAVRQALSGYQRIQLDLTANTAAQHRWLDQHRLFGPPALLFFNAQGREIKTLRVVGDMSREQFLDQLTRVQSHLGGNTRTASSPHYSLRRIQ